MKRGGLPIFARRGMSPLIATVLLMAFAVALGGMIMNWSVDTNKGGDCERISISVERMCAQNNNVILVMRNNPDSIPLAGIKILLSGSKSDSLLNIKDSALQPGQRLENIAVPAAYNVDTTVQILGVIGKNPSAEACSDPIVPQQPLQPC